MGIRTYLFLNTKVESLPSFFIVYFEKNKKEMDVNEKFSLQGKKYNLNNSNELQRQHLV